MFAEVNNKCTIGDVALLINGDRGSNYPSSEDFLDSGIPFINAGHLKDGGISYESMNFISREKYESLRSGKIEKDDILYCLRGSLGKQGIVSLNEGAIASSLVIIRCDLTKVLPIYLSYCLDSDNIQEQLARSNNGSSQPNLSAASVRRFIIPLPPIENQKQFVNFVRQVNKSKSEILEGIKRLKSNRITDNEPNSGS